MKKTTKKLELKKNIVRFLQAPELSGVAGGGNTNEATYCSTSCNTCVMCTKEYTQNQDYTYCPCV